MKNAKEKKPFKERLKEWWNDHDVQVITGALIVGTGIAGIFALKKAGDGMVASIQERELSDLKELTKIDPDTLSGTKADKIELLTDKVWEEKGLVELDDQIIDQVQELHEMCKGKGVEISLGAMLGGSSDYPEYFDLVHYTHSGYCIDRES